MGSNLKSNHLMMKRHVFQILWAQCQGKRNLQMLIQNIELHKYNYMYGIPYVEHLSPKIFQMVAHT